LGEHLTLDELVAAGDSLMPRRRQLCTLEELRTAEPVRRRNVVLARHALPHVRERVDSVKETQLRLLLIRAGLPEPDVNPEISRGRTVRYGDLVFWVWRVLVEYDGGQHRRDARQFAADVERLEQLAREGWTVIRVLAPHLAEPERVVRRVETALRDRGWRGRLSRSQLWRAPRPLT